MRLLLPALLMLSYSAASQPYIFYRGIVHSASFHPPGPAAGAIARGSIFSIFGKDLGPAQLAQPPSFPLDTELAGVSIQVRQGSTTIAAIPLVATASQINAIMPSNAPLGKVSVRVTYNGAAGNWSPVTVAASNPGIFSIGSSGVGPGVIQNYVNASDQPVNAASVTAAPGQIVTIWATGLGPIAGSDRDGPPAGDLPVAVDIFVGGKAATRLYAGRAPCCSGLDQIVAQLAEDTPTGCFVPVQVRADGAVSNTVTMAVAERGEACRDGSNPATATLLAGGKTGILLARRTDMLVDLDPDPSYNVITESVSATFRQEAATDWMSRLIFLAPPPGACSTYLMAGDFLRGRVRIPGAQGGSDLAAGAALSIATPRGAVSIPFEAGAANGYSDLVGAQVNTNVVTPLVFGTPGAFAVSATGGGLGGLQGTLQTQGPLTWVNRDQSTAIVRGQSFSVQWSGADAARDWVSIFGASVDVQQNTTGMFLCTADAGAGQFTVPALVTANLPQAATEGYDASAVLMVGSGPKAGSGVLTGAGLEKSVVMFGSWVGRTAGVR